MNYGRYQIIKEVGRGSMGVVYEARDPHIDRQVAVKVLRQDRSDSETFVNRFLKEAKVIGRLSHPNIVAIYDSGKEGDNVYLAMEFLTGSSLEDLAQGKPLQAHDVISYGVQIAEALDYAHQKGVVHRDIKPSNIVVQPDGVIKISDFGIAHIDDSSATMQTQAGDILGTPAYMSPEQVLGKPVDGRSDLFSLGVVLYELCTGRRAFGGKDRNLATIFNQIINVTPEEPVVIVSLIPEKLSGIVMKSLQKEPENRFQTGKEFAEALKDCRKVSPALDTSVHPRAERKKKSAVPVVAAVCLVIIAALIFVVVKMNPTSLTAPASSKSAAQPSQQPSRVLLPDKFELPDQKKPDFDNKMPVPAPSAEQSPVKPALDAKPHNVVNKPEKIPTAAAVFFDLKVRTAPPGASVTVDGDLKGVTPLTLHLPKGSHLLKMTRTGYREIKKQITLEETMEYPLTFQMKTVSEPD